MNRKWQLFGGEFGALKFGCVPSVTRFAKELVVQATNDLIAVAHVIQQSVAPVFLLSGVGAILSVLTNRLSRVIDRFRTLDERDDDKRHLMV